MDALEALADHGAHAEQPRALRRPVTRGAVAIFGASKHYERYTLLLVLHRRVVNRHLLAIGPVLCQATLGNVAIGSLEHEVLDADVGERATHHDLVIAAPRAVLIEVGRPHLVLAQELARRRG